MEKEKGPDQKDEGDEGRNEGRTEGRKKGNHHVFLKKETKHKVKEIKL